MPVKLIQYWNISHGRKNEFDVFFKDQFIPSVNRSDAVNMVGSWYVASGEGPYFIAEIVANSPDEMADLIMSPEFIDLRNSLLGLIEDYSSKLLFPTERLESMPIEVEHGFKFNRHFNINAADYYGCYSFMENEYFPLMTRFGIEMVGDWYVEVGSTPYVISEGRADDLSLISKMIQSRENQVLTLKLLSMATNYGCKVLVPSGHLNR